VSLLLLLKNSGSSGSGFVQEVGHNGSTATGTSLVITNSGAATTVGNDVLIIFTSNAAPGTVTATDSASNSGVVDVSETATTPFTYLIRIHQAASVVGTTGTFTITQGTTSGGRAATAAEYSGLVTTPLDQSVTDQLATNTANTLTNASANAQASELVIGGYAMAGATTANAATGYTLRTKGVSTGTIREAVLFDKVVSAIETSACAHTWTTTVVTGGVLGTYKLAASGTAWTVSPTDTLTLSDALDHFDYGMKPGDSLALSDAFTDVWAAVLSQGDTLTLSDANAFAYTLGTFADALTLSDLAAMSSGYNLSQADTLTLSDALNHFDYGMNPADNLTLSDAFADVWAAALAVADTITLSDAFSTGANLTLSLADTLTLSDVFSDVWTALLAVADSLSTADSFGDSWAAVVALSDSLTLTDLATPVLTGGATDWTITLADVLTLFDAVAAINPNLPRLVRYDSNDYDPNFARIRF